MLLIKSMKALATKSQADKLRLWGKVRGTEKDYYVIEGVVPAGEEAEGEGGAAVVEGMESRGTGINKFVYWVNNDPHTDKWLMLPDLKPNDIKNARNIKYTFSGDIDRKIYTNPFYFDTEKTYLRAQIARIYQSTTLVPKGLHRFQEENNREIEDNAPEEGELVKPSVQLMTKMDMWVHYTPQILKQGRLTHMDGKPLPGEEEVEPEVIQAREVKKDPHEPRLKPIVNDNKTRGGMPAWCLRSHNCKDNSVDPKTNKPGVNYGVVTVKSMWWPGSYSFYHN